MVRLLLLASALLLSGCGDDGSAADAGPPGADAGRADAGPLDCDTPATSCPAEQPHPGGPCVSGLECTYPVGDGVNDWTYTCPGDRWEAMATCEEVLGGCPVPPLAESCRTPFEGTLAGASVALGPPGPEAFRDFVDGERVALIYGNQGSPMLAFRVRLTGADAVTCGGLTATLSLGGPDTARSESAVVFRCGQTLDVFSIVTLDFCEERPYELTLDVEVAGVGSRQAHLEIMGGCFDGAPGG